MEQKTIKWKQSALCIAAMVLVAGLTFFILFKDHSVDTLWPVIKRADLRFILCGLGLMVLFVACEAAIIRLLAATYKRKVAWGRAMQYSFAGFYFSSVTPSSTGGQPMQLYYMVRDGLGAASSSFILLTITAMYQMVALLYGVIMVILKFQYIMGLPTALKLLIAFGITANGISSCAILLILFCRPLMELLVGKGIAILVRLHVVKSREAVEKKAAAMIEEYSKGGRYLRKYPRTALAAAALTALQLTCLHAASYCALLALGFTNISFLNFLMLQSIVSLAVSAVPLPGAVGVSESSFLVMFRSFFTESQLLSFMTLARGISFYGFLIISGLVVLYLQLHQSYYVPVSPIILFDKISGREYNEQCSYWERGNRKVNKPVTSKEKLLEMAKTIAYREGPGALNIRRVASESGIAIGTVYNYYPSKGDLLGAVMEDFWQNVFHGNDFDTQNGDFIASFREIYKRLRENLMKFCREFLDEMAAVSKDDQKKGKELEVFYLEHIKAGMLSILERDRKVNQQVWTEEFTKKQFVSFAFSNMLLMLKEQEEPDYFEEIMRRLIYQQAEKADETDG